MNAGQAAADAIRRMLGQIVVLEQQGKLSEAAELCSELLSRSPGSVPLKVMQARLLRQQGDFQQAQSALASAAALAPQSVAVIGELGKLALAQGDAEAACRQFEELVRVRPDNAEDWFNLGNASERAHRNDAAANAYRRSLSLGIARPEEVATRLGAVLIAMGREDEALGHFDRALAINGRDHQALYGKGMIMQAQGDFAAAEEFFLAAIEAEPEFVEAFQQLAESKRFDDADDPAAVRMRELLENSPTDYAREKLHFALGKICNDCGDYDAAFEHFAAANALKKKRQPSFDRDSFEALTREIARYFDRSRLTPTAHSSPSAITPVFIVGMPRSGTTLVEQILSSHSEVSGAGEIAFMDRLSRQRVEDYPRGLARLGDEALAGFRESYLHEIADHTEGHRYVTDKFPANFLHLGLINMIFPEAKFIYCKRDAMDNCLSIFMQDFGTGNYYANDLDDIAFYYRQHEKLVHHWHEVLNGRLLQIDYEQVIENQEQETRRLLAFLDLDWQDACLAFEKNPRKIATLSRWQVRQPIYKTAAGRWRRYATHLTKLRAALDYNDAD